MRTHTYMEDGYTHQKMLDTAKWMNIPALLHKDRIIAQNDAEWVFDELLQSEADFVPLRSEFASFMLLDENADMRDFIYWKRYDAISFNVFGRTTHQAVMSVLYQLEWMASHPSIEEFCDVEHHITTQLKNTKKGIAAMKDKDFICPSMLAEWFVTEGFGFFKSSQSSGITLGEDYVMSFAERKLFESYRIQRI